MFGLGITEIIVIGVVILLFTRAKKLPQIGGDLGKAVTNFRYAFRGEEKDSGMKKIDE